MAFDVFIGSQGSGKTLTSNHFLFDLVETTITDDKGKDKLVKVPRFKQYKRLITCVGGFNVEKFKEFIAPHDMQIIHHDKYLYKDDLVEIFTEQMEEKEKPQDERTPTLFIYDECQFGLDIFSQAQANLETCQLIRNFFALQRHYGPVDTVLLTQTRDNIHDKYLPEDFNLYISLEEKMKSDPNNDIVFDLYNPDGKDITIGGRNFIKYKKSKLIKFDNKELNPFDLYVSGDGGRKPVAKKQFWTKYIYILVSLVLAALIFIVYSLYSLFNFSSSSSNNSPSSEPLNAQTISKNINPNLKPKNIPKKQKDSVFDKYVEEEYSNINAQVMIKIFSSNDIYYFGSQILTLKSFAKLVKENVIFIVSTQPITKNSFYINILVHQALLNSYGIVKDHDSSTDKRVKSSLKKGI